MKKQMDSELKGHEYTLPLRREVSAVMHIIRAQSYKLKICLDIGFTHVGVSRYFRNKIGGFWMTVEPTSARSAMVADQLEEGTVFTLGPKGELPFEDRQFDAVILGHGSLSSDPDRTARMIREAHRVLKTGGLLLLTVEARKRFGLANYMNRNHPLSNTGGVFSEGDIFQLLKGGFDVLTFRYSCRFWVQLVRQWADRRAEKGLYGGSSFGLNFLYALAHILDAPLIWTRGYQMTVCGRRKGWREQGTKIKVKGVLVSDAILFDTKTN